ncbi:hypothetical protein [Ponticaulis sp.]|uniref:hypothetical protein n=1 Tax=Ponticaulis sp. TaxID=2020902 RepID=UPI000B6D14FE|nr:hypothetical protein [Ponticaulis sp.]MAI91222.1 hypothetical protein [Ponticaulis sp.]OUX98535.1 MAG: hypothetical protein CBB65_12310 [Hyphomonadaceae bacterium TMED5]|tara:strand:- start:62531 stop:63166 length:636 start_codon:yes stop_codon:yes gene_type:complete
MTMTRYIGFTAALSMGLMGVAQAQNSATVDAVATLEQSVAPLAIAGETSLSFGSVNIPNGTEVDHVCAYQISVSGETPQTALMEYSETGYITDTSVPTPSGCNWGSTGTANASYGSFAVSCNPASSVEFSATWTSGAATDVQLEETPGTSIRAFQSGTYTAISSGSGGAMTTNCPNTGILDVAIGGRVRIGTDASPSSDVTVGSIVLDATY